MKKAVLTFENISCCLECPYYKEVEDFGNSHMMCAGVVALGIRDYPAIVVNPDLDVLDNCPLPNQIVKKES